ncbi:MAG: FAD-binding oxidoreductase [Lentisphaeria bacterium]|nr:FAD-binding oxidoreductase [Lentisphaeria bacterium]
METPTHVLRPRSLNGATPPRWIEGRALADYGKYLTDESRHTGHAAALVFPTCIEEVAGAVLEARRRGLPVTVSNARTGIAGGAVPAGGLLLSLERMNRIRGLRHGPDVGFLVRCEAGVLLSELQDSVATGSFADSAGWSDESRACLERLRRGRYLYPPDPTERGAAMGGTIACNASGAHTFLYGPTRPYVQSLLVVLADGRVLDIGRGQARAREDGEFALALPGGGMRRGRIPSYRWPRTKNSGGYYAEPRMDLLDLFIGSEGTLGIIVGAEVRLVPAPEANCAVVTFWPDEAAAVAFTRRLRTERQDLGVEAIEYFGPNALDLLRQRRETMGAISGVPERLPGPGACAIYLDLGTDTGRLAAVLGSLCELVAAVGGDPEHCWSAMARDERERLRVFRHALPETVNGVIAEVRRRHPGVTKLGTDMAVPDEGLEGVLALYRSALDRAGLHYVVFGHIGDNHLHVNILPRDPAEYAAGRRLYEGFARDVVAMGGSPAAEHGIGKLKTSFLTILFGPEGLAEMRAVKAVFDPESRLGVGTLFPEEAQ